MRTSPGDHFDKLEYHDTIWVSSDFEQIQISEMDDQYIMNVVKLLKRIELKYNKKYKIPLLMTEGYERVREEHPEYFL